MTPVLSLNNVAKAYGPVKALKGVSFDVPEGSVFGILGPNGSGKTTLLSIILDVLHADQGDFKWFGKPSSPDLRQKIGSLLETPNFYHYMSAVSNLKITHQISGRGSYNDIDTVLEKVSLTARKNSKFSSYSLGMKQRLAIAAALLGDPKVLVLDEPTNGLDPVGIVEIRELIVQLQKAGNTIIIASHLLDEIEKVCTHVAILKTGTLLTTGPVEEVLSDEDMVELGAANTEQLLSVVRSLGSKVSFDEHTKMVLLSLPRGSARLEEINQHCFNNNVVLNHMILKKKRLEARFFELTNQ